MERAPKSIVKHGGSFSLPPWRSILIDGLLRPAAYPHAVGRIQLVETHISWVILTGDFAYKIKKPVELGFLDFREPDRRRFFCLEEVRLNRLWAPGIYLEVVPIVVQDGNPAVGGAGEPVEYAVRMRQFDQAMRLDYQLETGQLRAEDMLELAEEIAARHREAKALPPANRLLLVTKRLMWDNFDDLIGEVAADALSGLHRWTKATLVAREAKLRERCEQRFYRECHGDLHLGNIVRLPEGLRAFDCIEFSEELRQTDIVADYGFLVMDLVARGRTDLAHVFLNRYLEISGDYDGATLLPLYVVYRCLVRAKVAAIRRRERGPGESRDEDTATLDHYCELAGAWTLSRRPLLVVMSGLSGSGKTWLSTHLMAELPALRLRSDLERKRMFGLGERVDSHSGVGSGIYSRDIGAAVYARMFDKARSLMKTGFDVVLDAAFLDLEHRVRARRLAVDCDADFVIVRTTAPPATLEQRLVSRAAAGRDASEADLEVLRYQVGNDEPLAADEKVSAVTVDTGSEVDVSSVVLAMRERAAPERAIDRDVGAIRAPR